MTARPVSIGNPFVYLFNLTIWILACVKILTHVNTHACMHVCVLALRAKCRGLLLACCSCAVACGPVCRADR